MRFSLPAGEMLGRSAKRGRSTTMIRKHFRLKRIALGLALATAVVAPTAQAAVYVDGPTPGVQAGYIRAAAYQLKVEGMRWQAMAKQYESQPGSLPRAQCSRTRALGSPVSGQLKVEGMRWHGHGQAVQEPAWHHRRGRSAREPEAHGSAGSDHPGPRRRQCRTAASTGATPASAPRSPSAQRCCCSPRSGSGGDPGLEDWQASSASPGGG